MLLSELAKKDGTLQATLPAAPTVPQHGLGVHAHLQPHLDDAAHRPLVGLPAVPGADAARVPCKVLGRHQRTPGDLLHTLLATQRLIVCMVKGVAN